jgi:RNA polymerase sigma-70 factor (ECF subfamily)
MNEVTKAQTEISAIDFNKVYKEQKPRIELYLRTKTSDEELRNEVISQTFVKVYTGLEHGKFNSSKSSISTWVHTIARNTLIDEIRKNKNNLVHISDYTNENGDEILEFKDNGRGTDAVVENNELADSIMTAFNKVKPTYKEIAIQYFMYQKEYSEIADMLSIPLNTVKVAIMRAREVLQGQLKREYATM